MKRPLRTTIDYEPTHPATYVYYASRPLAKAPRSQRIGDSVVVDVDRDNDELVGIELLDMLPATLVAARQAAAEHDAEFPAHLTAVPA